MSTRLSPRANSGFTLVEILVVLVLSSFVLGATYEIMIAQSQSFGRQQEITDVQNSLRSTAVLLSTEIRAVDALDLYSMSNSSLRMRSYTASGIICGMDGTSLRMALIETAGGFSTTVGDSVLVLSTGDPGTLDDVWRVFSIDEVGTGASLGVSTCSWGDVPEVAIRLSAVTPGDTAGVSVGGSVLAFRPVEYGLHEDAGRWWLGRREGSAASWDLLAGPLLSPDDGGLELNYIDTAGTPAATLGDIAAVKIVVRAESFAEARSKQGHAYVRDSVAMRIVVRNSS